MATADVSLAQQIAERAADVLRETWATARTAGIRSADDYRDYRPGVEPAGIDLAVETQGDFPADPARTLAVHALDAVAWHYGDPIGELCQLMLDERPPGGTVTEWQYQGDPRSLDELKAVINSALLLLSTTDWWWTWLVEVTTELDHDNGEADIAAYLTNHPVRELEAVT